MSAARRLARACAEQCTSYGQTAFAAFAWHDAARLGAPITAREPLTSIAARVDGDLIPSFAGRATSLAAGDAIGLERAASMFEEMGALLFAAEAAAAAARCHRRQGRTGSALTSAARARQLAERCEGARTPALADLDSSLPLTAREREIADLAARCLTNREIADLLVVSLRTVDNHLHNAFSKLGITHRAELVGILRPATDC